MANRGLQSSNVSPHGVALPVVRDKNDLRVTLEVEHIPTAANLMAADCATVRIIREQPTFLIGQLHPLRDTRLMRLLAVRYPREQFIRRSTSNEKFRKESAELSAKAFPNWKPGTGAALFDAVDIGDAPAVTLDCDCELMVRTAETTSITFLSITPQEIHLASTGKKDDLYLFAPVEVTLALPLLVDLLNSWKTIAEGMGNGR